MRIVQTPIARPNCCAVYPHLGSGQIRGYFDTGTELGEIDPHIYVSVVAVEEMAKQLGWIPGEEHAALAEQLQDALDAIEALRAENGELQTRFEAIDVLESAGHRARKKAGRPPIKKPEGVPA